MKIVYSITTIALLYVFPGRGATEDSATVPVPDTIVSAQMNDAEVMAVEEPADTANETTIVNSVTPRDEEVTGQASLPVVPKDTLVSDTVDGDIEDTAAGNNETEQMLLDEQDLFIEGEEELIIADEETLQDTARETSDTVTAYTDGDSSALQEREIGGKADAKDTQADSSRDEEKQQAFVVNERKETRSINFAQNLDEYRSPKLAMLFSFILPGLGEIYAKNYRRAAIFLASEITLGATVYHFRQQAKEYNRRAKKHADTAYSVSHFENYYDSLKSLIEFTAQQDNDIPGNVDSIVDTSYSFFGGYTGGQGFDILEFKADSGTDDMYDIIEEKKFIQGWKDAAPRLRTDAIHGDTVTLQMNDTESPYHGKQVRYAPVDSSAAIGIPAKFFLAGEKERYWGFSDYYDTYDRLVRRKNTRYSHAKIALVFMMVNRIVSALDAGLCAHAYNQALLEEKSVWEGVRLESRIVGNKKGLGLHCGVEVSF